jgi:hypothetical protein
VLRLRFYQNSATAFVSGSATLWAVHGECQEVVTAHLSPVCFCHNVQERRPLESRILSEAEWRLLQSRLDGGSNGATSHQLVQTEARGTPLSLKYLYIKR